MKPLKEDHVHLSTTRYGPVHKLFQGLLHQGGLKAQLNIKVLTKS